MSEETVQTSREHWFNTEGAEDMLRKGGKFILTTALDHKGRIKLIFEGAEGKKKAYWMDRKAYDQYQTWQHPHLIFTIENFAGMVPAKNADIYDPEDGSYTPRTRVLPVGGRKKRSGKSPRLTR